MKKLASCNQNLFIKGFTLVEMAVVLIIIGFVIGALLTPLGAQRDLRDYSESKARLEQIRDALYGYAIINGKMPCPTTTTNPADNINYGHADSACALSAAAGFLPWKDLGIAETDSWGVPRTQTTDAWLGYWVYRVDPAFTSTFSLTTNTTGNIDIRKSDGTSQTIAAERAVVVICSLGKDRTANGQNATFESSNPIYEDDAQSPTFDDMCIWITRPSLFNKMVSAGKLP